MQLTNNDKAAELIVLGTLLADPDRLADVQPSDFGATVGAIVQAMQERKYSRVDDLVRHAFNVARIDGEKLTDAFIGRVKRTGEYRRYSRINPLAVSVARVIDAAREKQARKSTTAMKDS